MTKDDIIRMAKEAGGYMPEHYPDELRRDTDDLARFAAIVAATEREACVNICNELHIFGEHQNLQIATIEDCVTAIRARGQE